MNRQFNLSDLFLFLLFAVVIYFPLFLHLDGVGLYRWDEATNALQAVEMSESGNYLVRTIFGEPDHWETKPPLLTWLQVFFIKIFGIGELAIRLPSALAALGTIFLIVRFFIKEWDDIYGGIFSALTLVSAQGYIGFHVTRTGDHDALLIFFLIGFLLYFYKYIKSEQTQKQYLYISTFALIGGVYTKSIAGLFFLPGIFIFLLFQKKIKTTFSNKNNYFAGLTFLIVVAAYYLLRERVDEGYLYHVSQNELFHRYLNTATTYQYNVAKSPWFYLELLRDKFFTPFYLWLPISILIIFLERQKDKISFLFLLILTAISFTTIISRGTVNEWYVAPAIPLLSMIVGLGISLIFNSLCKNFSILKNWQRNLVFIFFSLPIFFFPYKKTIFEQAYFPQPDSHEMMYGDFMAKVSREIPDLKNWFIYYECVNRHVLFYKKKFKKLGYNIEECGHCKSIVNCKKNPAIGDAIIICNRTFQKEFEERFQLDITLVDKSCKLYQVLGNK